MVDFHVKKIMLSLGQSTHQEQRSCRVAADKDSVLRLNRGDSIFQRYNFRFILFQPVHTTYSVLWRFVIRPNRFACSRSKILATALLVQRPPKVHTPLASPGFLRNDFSMPVFAVSSKYGTIAFVKAAVAVRP